MNKDRLAAFTDAVWTIFLGMVIVEIDSLMVSIRK